MKINLTDMSFGNILRKRINNEVCIICGRQGEHLVIHATEYHSIPKLSKLKDGKEIYFCDKCYKRTLWSGQITDIESKLHENHN
jgi:hypothetical protein